MIKSPLRYPGGKGRLYTTMARVLARNTNRPVVYGEPYAGGAALALSLLDMGYAEKIFINDLDDGVYAFWLSVVEKTDDLVELINSTEVTVAEWQKQRHILVNTDCSLQKGFAFFFLNRTSRSGIVGSGGVIGGLEQNGAYKIDCRFNKQELVDRIRLIAHKSDKIFVTNLDAALFIDRFDELALENGFLYIDPPYFVKGSSLYRNHYKHSDHSAISQILKRISTPWVLTYDTADEVRALYNWAKASKFNLNYSVQRKRIAQEYMFFSQNIRVYLRDLGAGFIRI